MNIQLKNTIELELQRLSGLTPAEILNPQGNRPRLVRRVLAWAFIQLAKEPPAKVSRELKIQHQCSISRIMRKKLLPAEEYDLRRRLTQRLMLLRAQERPSTVTEKRERA